MQPSTAVSVVIVNYNAGELLEQLVKKLQALPLQQIVVIDNASSDQSTANMVSDKQLRCIINQKNHGFAYACNQGVAQTDTPLVLILNPDCDLSAEALSQLTDVLEQQSQAGLCAPLVLDAQGHEQSGSRRHLPTPWRILQAYTGKKRALDLRTQAVPQQPTQLPAVSGACMLIRRSAWDDIGGMDAGFFLHFEDLDLMARMQQQGWGIWLQPAASVRHLGGHSSQQHAIRVSWYKHKSLLRYLIKHHPGSILAWTLMPILAMLHFLAVALSAMPKAAIKAITRQ